jgi:hypothetical protein
LALLTFPRAAQSAEILIRDDSSRREALPWRRVARAQAYCGSYSGC